MERLVRLAGFSLAGSENGQEPLAMIGMWRVCMLAALMPKADTNAKTKWADILCRTSALWHLPTLKLPMQMETPDTPPVPNSPQMAGCQQEPCSLSSETPRTAALMLENGRAIAACKTRPAIWPVMMAMETALRASIAWEKARCERIRFVCFGDVPERLAGETSNWIKALLENEEEEAHETFIKLRNAALCLPENK